MDGRHSRRCGTFLLWTDSCQAGCGVSFGKRTSPFAHRKKKQIPASGAPTDAKKAAPARKRDFKKKESKEKTHQVLTFIDHKLY